MMKSSEGLWSLEYIVQLLSDSDESGPSTQFLQFLGPDVRTGGPHSSEDVLCSGLHVSSVLYLNCLTLRRSAERWRNLNSLSRQKSVLQSGFSTTIYTLEL